LLDEDFEEFLFVLNHPIVNSYGIVSVFDKKFDRVPVLKHFKNLKARLAQPYWSPCPVNIGINIL